MAYREATRAPNAPIGNPSNHWDMLSVSYPNVTAYPLIPAKLFPDEFTIILTHPLRVSFLLSSSHS